MPMAPPTPCAQPLCPELTYGTQYCPDHAKRERTYDLHRESSSKRGYGAKWRKLRSAFLARHLKCVGWPAGRQCWAAATEVDHIVPKALGGGNEMANLQGLCKRCHSRKTMSEMR